MKNVTVISCIAILLLMSSSCATQRKVIEPQSNFSSIDFRKYSNAGFLITPEKYSGDYTSIGIIDYIKKPGARYVSTVKSTGTNSDGQGVYEPGMKWAIEYVSLEQAIDEVYKQCLKMGADAIINFKVDTDREPYYNQSNPVTIIGYHITGFAIKRK